jgi:hypothetical protein
MKPEKLLGTKQQTKILCLEGATLGGAHLIGHDEGLPGGRVLIPGL